MHCLMRDYNTGRHSDYLIRCRARSESSLRRYQARIERDGTTYTEAERFLLSWNRFQHPAAKQGELAIRTRLFIAWSEWLASGQTPSARLIIERSTKGALTWI
ncbi:hypothetical protein EP7_005635 (plasmid) [Isosphaeraceae bacterium EP7]